MKSKHSRWVLLFAGLALISGCRSSSSMSTGDYVNLRESYAYIPPGSGFYDPWYGGGGAYVGAGGYGGASFGISVPVGGSD